MKRTELEKAVERAIFLYGDGAVQLTKDKEIKEVIESGLEKRQGKCPCSSSPLQCPCSSLDSVMKGKIKTCKCGLFIGV